MTVRVSAAVSKHAALDCAFESVAAGQDFNFQKSWFFLSRRYSWEAGKISGKP